MKLHLNPLPRILLTLVLAALAAFCIFGFLASFEHPFPNAWHFAYAGIFAILGIAIRRVWHRRRKSHEP